MLIFSDEGWEDYLYWQQNDKKILKKINRLLKDIQREPFSGIGEPEPLKYNWSGYWSRRITIEHRLVCDILHPVNEVASCFKVPYLVNQSD